MSGWRWVGSPMGNGSCTIGRVRDLAHDVRELGIRYSSGLPMFTGSTTSSRRNDETGTSVVDTTEGPRLHQSP
jgi:hypothetical protein